MTRSTLCACVWHLRHINLVSQVLMRISSTELKVFTLWFACVSSSCMIIEYRWSSCWVQPLFGPVYLFVFLLFSLLEASLHCIYRVYRNAFSPWGGGEVIIVIVGYDLCVCVCLTYLKNQCHLCQWLREMAWVVLGSMWLAELTSFPAWLHACQRLFKSKW